ncbi:MAG: hypothetical protein JO307_32105 [Bryobacterales bacterium]|nr:hypothetical protein [Bryobacterales bacterium]MBV9400051.1 hypothetical protein [Bryobacterales bacterium]
MPPVDVMTFDEILALEERYSVVLGGEAPGRSAAGAPSKRASVDKDPKRRALSRKRTRERATEQDAKAK